MAVYFASDFHLGFNKPIPSREREKIIVSWLNDILNDTDELYILGDLFDHWYEYSQVVPKGFIRVLAKLAEFTDKSIPVHIFTGNHDLWMFDYLEKEIGALIHRSPITKQIGNHSFFLGHGDGLGPGDTGYKLIKKVFSSKLNQWLFARIHPNTGLKIMKFFSYKSRESEDIVIDFLGAENEWLIQYAEKKLKEKYFDFFLFGHRHLPIDFTLSNNKSRYVNTGDWITHYSYARYNYNELELLYYKKPEGLV